MFEKDDLVRENGKEVYAGGGVGGMLTVEIPQLCVSSEMRCDLN
jgi:hypothetical protein